MTANVRQKRNYNVYFEAGELVWVYSPLRKKECCPKLDNQWVGHCRVLESMEEVVHWVQLPPRGGKVALPQDRLAPKKGASSIKCIYKALFYIFRCHKMLYRNSA